MTAPVAPSMPFTTFCVTVGRAHRNSPVLAIQCVHNTGLAGNPGEDLAALAGADSFGFIHGDVTRVGRHSGVHKHSFEGMIEIPVVDNVLVVPHDLSGVGVQERAWNCGRGAYCCCRPE